MDTKISDDLLDGANEIAEFLGITRRRAFYLIERELIPAGRLGSRIIASKSALRAHMARLTRGEVA